jgi:hypothetical protein
LSFAETTDLNTAGTVAKIGLPIEASILQKFRREHGMIEEYEGSGRSPIFYTRKLSHFVQILDFVPSIKDEDGAPREPSELKRLNFADPGHRDVFLAFLNSSLFYWLLTVYSDCRNLNRREIALARFDFSRPVSKAHVTDLHGLARRLMTDIRRHSRVLTMRYKDHGELRIQCTYPRCSKEIIDEIDGVLGHHLELTNDEVDFITNYDTKYRMGQDGEDDHE